MENIITYIRNVMRKEGISGMESINHCIAFIVCRMLDDELCEKVKIDKKYSYENIMKDDEGDVVGDQELYSRIFTKGKADGCLIGQLVNKLGFKNIKFKMEGVQHVKEIMKKLKEFDPKKLSLKFDIIGTIYELHLKSGTSNAMRDLGQYYTNRQVIEYMIKLCDPVMNKKGEIESILDPSMGTGGFLTMSVKYLNDKYKNKVDWSKNKNNIIGFDIDDNVRNMALLNILLETGELCDKSLVKNDTLYNDLKFADDTILQKAKVILANEPMGLKNIIHASCCSRIKDLKIRGTKAEPLFLQLFMEALDDGGRCAVIVPDGVLFNDSTLHNDTRKYMVENFNLKKVVALSDDFFLNTGVKTSILYFTKDGKKTEEVEFSSIKLKNSEIDETSIIKVKYDDLRKNKFSLFVNKYNVQAVEKVGGVEYKKIGDICEFISSKFNSGIMDNSGQYNFYNGKAENPDGTHSEYNFDYDEYLAIIKGGGAGQGKYGNQIGLGKTFYLKGKNAVSNGLYVLKVNDKKINVKYLYHYLLQNKNIIMDLATYTTGLGNIKQETLKLLEIPIPSLTIQKQIVESLDLLSENITTSKKQIEESKKILHKYVQCQTVHEKDVKLNEFCIFNSENLTNDKNIKFINYIDIGSIDNEKITNITKLTEDFPSRAKRLVKKNDILLSSVRPNLRKYVFINENIENGVCSTGFCVIRPNPEIVNPKYIYYQISSDSATEYLTSNATGSQYPAVNCDIIENISIKVPPLNKQNDIVKYCENNEIMINLNEDRIKNNEDLMKQILNEYLKNNDDSKKENNESGESSSDSEKEDTKVKNIKEKKIVKKVAKKEESSLSDSEEEKTANKNSKTKK